MSDEKKEMLILSIIKFLIKEAERASAEKKESIEVAIQCLEAAFNVDYRSRTTRAGEIPDLYVPSTSAQATKLAEADGFKAKGNDLVRIGKYQEAIDHYTRAILLNPNCAVYYCNRAAAYSRLENHERAIADCEEAVKIDPTYAKAYGRLGIAYSSLNRFREAADAYRNAVSADPGNTMYEENLRLATERLDAQANVPAAAQGRFPPDIPHIDFGPFVNNPNLLNMASRMLGDPGFSNMVAGILNVNQRGDGPSIDTLMQMGQRLAHHMNEQDPEYMENLRRRYANPLNPEENLFAGEDDGEAEEPDLPLPNENHNAVDVDPEELDVGDLDVGDLDVGDLDVGDLDVGDLDAGDLDIGDLEAGELEAEVLNVVDFEAAGLAAEERAAADRAAEERAAADRAAAERAAAERAAAERAVANHGVANGEAANDDAANGDAANGEAAVRDPPAAN